MSSRRTCNKNSRAGELSPILRRGVVPSRCAWLAAVVLLAVSISSANAAVEIQNGQVSSQWPEIGMLVVTQDSGNDYCTATAIAPRWVLTAAHCVNSTDPTATYSFIVGSSIDAPDATTYAIDQVTYDSNFSSAHPENGYDAGLAHIKDVDLPNSTFKLYSLTLPAAFTTPGVDVAVFGFGITSASSGSFGTKRFELTKVAVDPTFHNDLASLSATSGTCPGDSGGPAFIYDSDGFPVIVGLTSFGSVSNCLAGTDFSRIDKSWSFIETTLVDASDSACQVTESCEGILRDGFDGPL